MPTTTTKAAMSTNYIEMSVCVCAGERVNWICILYERVFGLKTIHFIFVDKKRGSSRGESEMDEVADLIVLNWKLFLFLILEFQETFGIFYTEQASIRKFSKITKRKLWNL